MSKAILIHKSEQAADASARAAIEAAQLLRCGCAFEAECMEARSVRLAALSASFAKAARVTK